MSKLLTCGVYPVIDPIPKCHWSNMMESISCNIQMVNSSSRSSMLMMSLLCFFVCKFYKYLWVWCFACLSYFHFVLWHQSMKELIQVFEWILRYSNGPDHFVFWSVSHVCIMLTASRVTASSSSQFGVFGCEPAASSLSTGYHKHTRGGSVCWPIKVYVKAHLLY